MNFRTTIRLALPLMAGLAAVAVGVFFATRERATSQEGTGVVDFTRLTPQGYDFTVLPGTPNYPPDFENVPTCQAPADEKPDPELPPLSCRFSANEPRPGTIKTATPDEIPPTDSDAGLPEGWTLVDNRLFRYTVGLPPGWYSDMRPEGGAFYFFDTTAKTAKELNGGVVIHFTARETADRIPPESDFAAEAEKHVAQPNAMFGSVPGAIWEAGDDEGQISVRKAAFIRDGVTFEIRVGFLIGGSAEQLAVDRAIVEQVLVSVLPY